MGEYLYVLVPSKKIALGIGRKIAFEELCKEITKKIEEYRPFEVEEKTPQHLTLEDIKILIEAKEIADLLFDNYWDFVRYLTIESILENYKDAKIVSDYDNDFNLDGYKVIDIY